MLGISAKEGIVRDEDPNWWGIRGCRGQTAAAGWSDV